MLLRIKQLYTALFENTALIVTCYSVHTECTTRYHEYIIFKKSLSNSTFIIFVIYFFKFCYKKNHIYVKVYYIRAALNCWSIRPDRFRSSVVQADDIKGCITRAATLIFVDIFFGNQIVGKIEAYSSYGITGTG